ncbi:MAG: hypothetical protein Q9217_000374 [Psora testacea]
MSVDLTYLPQQPSSQTTPSAPKSNGQVEYSAREVALPALLLQQILRAHDIFLAHHSSSLTELFSRVSREKFCRFLKRFWNEYIGRWDVLLHGNPAVDIYNGIKLSAGGELGIGVGEEDWGSGEREVLEGFIQRTDGLVDLMVSRFEPVPNQNRDRARSATPSRPYYGNGDYPQPSDGLIFSGIGALTRPSIKNVSAWVEWIAMYGADAYGIRDNPSSNPRRKRTKVEGPFGTAIRKRTVSHGLPQTRNDPAAASSDASPPGVPASIVHLTGARRIITSSSHSSANGFANQPGKQSTSDSEDTNAGIEILKYLTLGIYGSSWGISADRPAVHRQVSTFRADVSSKPSDVDSREQNTLSGRFLIGLLGDLEDDRTSDAEGRKQDQGSDGDGDAGTKEFNGRVLIRHLHVERIKSESSKKERESPKSQENVDEIYHDRLRVVVYVYQPFIFTFLFEPQTDCLAIPAFYRSLHHQLGPLRRPLLKSTDPDKVSQRLWDAASTKTTAATCSSQRICDLVYDPTRLTVHTSIPNIPEPRFNSTDASDTWTRIEALSVHSQILNTYVSTRRHSSQLERTCKTSRDWWVVWMRLPHPPTTLATHSSSYREAFLIRKASDYVAPKPRVTSLGFGVNRGGRSSGAGWGPAKLAEGIGIDARQYIDGLLSLNR